MVDRLKTLITYEIQRSTSFTAQESAMPCQAIVARQPIFDPQGNIWGYELLYRKPSNTETSEIASGAVETANVIVNCLEMVYPGLKPSQKVLINFTEDLIVAQVAKALPRDICIVEILEDVEPTPQVLAAVEDIKAAGYTIAIDDYTGQDNLKPLLPMADIVKVDVLGRSQDEVRKLALGLKAYKCKYLTEKVEDAGMAGLCTQLGFSLFQGFFFGKPELITGKRISPSQAMRMRILALCISDTIDIKAISEIIRHDPVVMVNFMRYINSVHFGFHSTIHSIEHALILVGSMAFMQWLCVSLLATLENGPMAREFAFLASQRAKYLETLGKRLGKALPANISTSSLFLTGLLSLLTRVMGMPLKEILKGVPLDQEVMDALSGEASPYSVWLDLMNYHEHGEWEAAEEVAGQLHLTENDLREAYAEALQWSSSFFESG